MTAKTSRRFMQTLDNVMLNASMNARSYDSFPPAEVQWAMLAQLIDLNFEIRELREELRAARDNK